MPAFCSVLQEKIPGVDATGLECRALSKHSERLEALAELAGVISLMNTFGASEDEMAGFLEGGDNANLPEENWFSADEGLQTIAALLKALADQPIPEAPVLAADLAQFQQRSRGFSRAERALASGHRL